MFTLYHTDVTDRFKTTTTLYYVTHRKMVIIKDGPIMRAFLFVGAYIISRRYCYVLRGISATRWSDCVMWKLQHK